MFSYIYHCLFSFDHEMFHYIRIHPESYIFPVTPCATFQGLFKFGLSKYFQFSFSFIMAMSFLVSNRILTLIVLIFSYTGLYIVILPISSDDILFNILFPFVLTFCLLCSTACLFMSYISTTKAPRFHKFFLGGYTFTCKKGFII